MNTLKIIISFLICTSCISYSDKEKELKNVLGNKIELDQFELILCGNDTISKNEFFKRYEFTSIVYLKDGCVPCYPKFVEWHHWFLNINKLHNNYAVLFIIQGYNYKTFLKKVNEIEQINFDHFIIMDPNFEFREQNKKIPYWIIERSLLIDNKNKIKLVGFPFYNEDMKNMFHKIILNK